MLPQTPIERAIATYRNDWAKISLNSSGYSRVNPETLANKTDADFSFRYIDIASVDRGSIDWKSIHTLRFGDAPSRARRVVKTGDLLICTVRPLLGSHAYIQPINDDSPTICSTGFAVIRASAGLEPAFLKHLAFSEQVTRQMVAWQCGTNYPAVNERDVRKITIPAPAIEEQIAIARVLDAVDDAIERARDARTKAKSLDHSLLHVLLDFGIAANGSRSKPVHWQTKRVDEVAEVGSGVTLGKDITGFKYVELPYLRVANVQDGHLDLNTIKTVKVRCGEVERYRLEPGDVLMTEGGDLDKLGRGTLWEGQIKDCLHQNHIFRIRADRTQLDPRYFAFVVESDIAKRYFTRVAKRTTNLASTNKTQVRAFRFPLPPMNEQGQIADAMSASKATIRAIESKIAALTQLKKSLMHDLLTGTVRVDPVLFNKKEKAS
jgi:type I restriction enzyme S subunit